MHFEFGQGCSCMECSQLNALFSKFYHFKTLFFSTIDRLLIEFQQSTFDRPSIDYQGYPQYTYSTQVIETLPHLQSQECLCPRNFKSNKQVTYQLFSAKLQPLPVDDDEYFASGEPGQVQLHELSNHTAVLSGDIWGAKYEAKLSLNLP